VECEAQCLRSGDCFASCRPNNVLTGIFLDPTGDFNINEAVLNGRLFGGDSLNSSIVSSGCIHQPHSAVPEPKRVLIPLGFGLVVALVFRKKLSRA